MNNITLMLESVRARHNLSYHDMARVLGTSFVSVHRWIRGTTQPSPAMVSRIQAYYDETQLLTETQKTFEGYGIGKSLPLFDTLLPHVHLASEPFPPILERISDGSFIHGNAATLRNLLARNATPVTITDSPPLQGMSAGKNTYTYDAHTYHTKVPPQGIAELLAHYLPEGGLILDPFAGSGMTGVAARSLGYDCILNDISPAAAFIAAQFNAAIDPDLFEAGVKAILRETEPLRQTLYQTRCRECGKSTELQYVVWSYHVLCPHCSTEFQLWDHCRSYGSRVKEHKILSVFDCPTCHIPLKKSSLKRTNAYPVMVGYKCCGSQQQEMTHSPSQEDLELIAAIERDPPWVESVIPQTALYEGVNLRQPMNHGLDRVDKFYTRRNLAALSQLWAAIHRIEDAALASFLAFTFTSLYQRVTKLSEFRFWGGSGNTARFNVPYIFNEANVFLTFIRKAKSIHDHLRTTAKTYSGQTIVINGSATDLVHIPHESIDLIFTDPPFGANINYSEMNILWESWLGRFTNITKESIVNKVQGKDIHAYESLMHESLCECFRVLKPQGWMLIMFMNTSKDVWEALRNAITRAGFVVEHISLFDKQHGTFKQFVNEHAAGFDLVLHCRKGCEAPSQYMNQHKATDDPTLHIVSFINQHRENIPYITYLHVQRDNEIDYRQLYSEWLSIAMANSISTVDLARFRSIVDATLGMEGIR